MHYFCTYTVKKVNDFPVPSRDVTNQILLGWEKLNFSRPGRVWLVTSRLGTGKSLNLFYSVRVFQIPVHCQFRIANGLDAGL
jgi:hypothetical protein